MAKNYLPLHAYLYPEREEDRQLIDYINSVSVPKSTLVKEAIKAFMKTDKGKAFKK